jgi:hypothetical protein
VASVVNGYRVLALDVKMAHVPADAGGRGNSPEHGGSALLAADPAEWHSARLRLTPDGRIAR